MAMYRPCRQRMQQSSAQARKTHACDRKCTFDNVYMGMYSGLNIHDPQTKGFSGNTENMHLGSLHRVGMCESKFVLLLVISGGYFG